VYPKATIDALVIVAGSKDLMEGNPSTETRSHHQNLIKNGFFGTENPCGH